MQNICKPVDDFTDDIMDDAVDCAAEIFSECMNEEEGNMRLVGMLEIIGSKSDSFTYNVSHNNKMKLQIVYWWLQWWGYSSKDIHNSLHWIQWKIKLIQT